FHRRLVSGASKSRSGAGQNPTQANTPFGLQRHRTQAKVDCCFTPRLLASQDRERVAHHRRLQFPLTTALDIVLALRALTNCFLDRPVHSRQAISFCSPALLASEKRCSACSFSLSRVTMVDESCCRFLARTVTLPLALSLTHMELSVGVCSTA